MRSVRASGLMDAQGTRERAGDPWCLVRPEGFEPPTLWSEARCSNPLSYGRVCTTSLLARASFLPDRLLVGARGFEPPTSSSRTTRATKLRYAPTDPVQDGREG